MKTIKHTIFFLFLIGLSSVASAQSVSNKEGVTSIDDVPFFKIDGGSLIQHDNPAKILNYNNGTIVFVITKRETFKTNRGWYNYVNFEEFEVWFNTELDYKPLIKSMYQNGVFTKEAEVNEEALKKYAKEFAIPYKIP